MMMSRSLGLALGMMLTLWLLVAPSAQAAREKPPSRLIEDILKQRPWPIVQVYGVAPGNATGSISSGDWQRAMRGMIADYQKEIPDLVSPYHFLNGNFHLLALDASPELLARAEERLESLRRASLEKLGYYPAQRHLHVSGNASSSGSGAIVDARGFVLTAAHVIARFQQFNAPYVVACYAPVERMRADTGLAHSHPEGARQGVGVVEYEATTVAIDRPGDVALLKIQAGAPLPFLPLADKSEPAEDDTVVGLAIPDGSSQRIQSWVAKVTGRNHSHNPGDRHFFIDYLIKPGYSGGPVCNLRGEVLGQAAALVSIKHPNIASEIPGRTSVSYADKASAVARPLRQRPALEGRPSLEWVNRQGWRILAPVPRVLADLGVEEGDLIVWATTRRADRYSVEDDRIGCVWDEKKPGLYSVSMGKDFLSKAMEDAGVGGWLLLRLARGEESRVAQVRLQGT